MNNRHKQLEPFPKEQVRSAIQTGMEQAEKQRRKESVNPQQHRRNKVKRRIFYVFGSVAVIFVILIGSSYYSPALASSLSQIPIIGSVFESSNLANLEKAHKQGLTSQIGETQTVNGISVTLDEVLYDQNNISISYIIDSEKPLEENYTSAGMEFTINGESPNMGSLMYMESSQSATTRTAVQEISVTKEMPDKFELGVILKGENEEVWNFSTSVEKMENIQTIPVQHSQSADGINLTITDLSLSELGVSISYESLDEKTNFGITRVDRIGINLFDQDGNEIKSFSGSGESWFFDNNPGFKNIELFDPIDSNVTELTIIPYLNRGAEFDKNGEEIKIEKEDVDFEPIIIEIPK